MEYISQEVLNKIKTNQLLTIYLKQMAMILLCVHFIASNLFSLNDHEKNDKVIYKYFKGKYVKSPV